MKNKVEAAVAAIARGEMIIVTDHPDREDEGDLLMAASMATPEAISFMAKEGRGLICVPIEDQLAHQLELPRMVVNNEDPMGTAFTVSIDGQNTTTGISAFDRAESIAAMLRSGASAKDFRKPGHIFPLIANPGGVLKRQGHTEAAVDLAKMAGLEPAGVICEIMGDDGTMLRGASLEAYAQKHQLQMISIAELVAYKQELIWSDQANLPTQYGHFTIQAFKSPNSELEHAMLIYGDAHQQTAPLVRMHSECLTGDVFGSNKCDCGNQLERAMETISKEGAGIILYLRQEGRGIGLVNKINAYHHQDQGMDTVDANLALGLPEDNRDYGLAAQALKEAGFTDVTLLTNNPLKISGLEENGLGVHHRQALVTGIHEANKEYMKTKRERMGHLYAMEEIV